MDKSKFTKVLVVAIIVFFLIEMFMWWRGSSGQQVNYKVYNSTGFASGKVISYEPYLIVPLSEKNKNIIQNLINSNEIEYYSISERGIKAVLKDSRDILKVREKFDSAMSMATISFSLGKFNINGSVQELPLEPISIAMDPYVGEDQIDFELSVTIYEIGNTKSAKIINLNPIPREEHIAVNGTMNCSSVTIIGYVNWEDRFNTTYKGEVEKLGNVSVFISNEVKYSISPFQMEETEKKLNESGINFSNFTVRSFITNSTEREKIAELFSTINVTPSFPRSEVHINITNGSIEEKIARSKDVQKYFANSTVKGVCDVKIVSEYYPHEIGKKVSLEIENIKAEFTAEVPVERIGNLIISADMEKMKVR